MRLPFLQVAQDALTRARTMARLLGIPEAHGVGLAVSLFAWALDLTSEGDLSGQIPDEKPAEVVAAALGWAGDPEKLYSALERAGFIERVPTERRDQDGFDRVKGLSRYGKALTNAEGRSEKARRAANARWAPPTHAPAMLDACSEHAQAMHPHARPMLTHAPSNASAMLGDAKTQTQTHTHKEEEKSAPAARAPLSAAAAAGPSLSERMCEEFRRQRGALYAWTRKDDGAVGALLSLSGGNEAEVERRWRIALAWRGFPECATPGELARNWNHYARAQDAPGAGPKSDRARL